MGRYYRGTISGKFLFAVQNSYDASSFKKPDDLVPEPYFEYYGCYCIADNPNDSYCHECYSSYEDHYASLDECDKSDVTNGEQISYETVFIKYEFDIDELDYITQKINEIENEIKKESGDADIIAKLNYRIDEENDFEYDIDIDFLSDIYKNKGENEDDKYNLILELVARWGFGKQIQKALQTCNECIIHCET